MRRWQVVAGGLWVIRYLTLGHIPWLRTPLWADWYDQSQYLRSALALYSGILRPSEHWYPLLYPAAAVPFVPLLPSDPFFLLDLLLYLVTAAAFRRVAALLDVAPSTALACFLATTILQTGIASAWVHPWTSTLSAALAWWLLYLVLRFVRGGRQPDGALALALGCLAAALPLVRPLDALVGLAAGGVVAVDCVVARRPLVRLAGMALLGAAVVIAPYAILHVAIYGWNLTEYMQGEAKVGFIPGDLGWKAYVLLVSAEPWFPGARAIGQVLPWAPIGAAGLIAGFLARQHDRLVVGTFALLALPGATLMLTFADLEPPGLWYFGNVHYFKWLLPMLGLGVILLMRTALDRTGARAAAAGLAVVAAGLGFAIRPVVVGADAPARMLFFHGRSGRDWQEAYFAPAVIRDRAGVQHNAPDFHQIPDGTTQRALAIRRLFAPDARRFDPQEAPSLNGRLAFRRFGERVTWFGIPL